ncbi:MAG: hypothetical protein R3B13_31640 [Polyangiaceae bacterium]
MPLAFCEQARAQACCTATGNSDVGIVRPGARAALALESSWEHASWSYAADARQHALHDARADDWVLAVGGGYRVWRPLQLHGALPLRLQRRRLGDETAETDVRPGDALLGARFLLHEDPMPAHAAPRLAQVEAFSFSKIPTGRDANEAEARTGVDATGDGVWQLGLGLGAALRVPRVHWFDASVGFALRFPHTVEGRELEPGDEVQARASYAWVPDVYLALGTFASYRATLPAKENGVELAESSTRRFRVGIFARHALRHPSWHLQTSLSSDLPFDGFGRNVPYAGTTLSLSILRTWIR